MLAGLMLAAFLAIFFDLDEDFRGMVSNVVGYQVSGALYYAVFMVIGWVFRL